MKPIALVFFGVFVSCQLIAQDWRPIQPRFTAMYFDGQYYQAVRIDSTVVNADTTHHWGFKQFSDTAERFCFVIDRNTWFGNEIIDYPDKTIIKNAKGQDIVFPTKATEKWPFWTSANDTIWATLTESKTLGFLGLTDSVRIIAIDSGNEDWGSHSLILSKHYGLVETMCFGAFPNQLNWISTNFRYATLAGISEGNLGIQNLLQAEIFYHNVGDVHQTLQVWDDFYNPVASYYRQINTILDVNNTNENYRYQIQTCKKEGIDTNWVEFPIWGMLDSLSGSPVFVDDNFVTLVFQTNFQNYQCKTFSYNFTDEGEGCYHPLITTKKSKSDISPFGYYVQWLGGFYSEQHGDLNYSSYELTYYKINNTEWGTPYNCEDIINSVPDVLSNAVKLFPNPASHNVTITIEREVGNAEITLVSSLGEVVHKQNLYLSVTQITLDPLSAGIYFYQIKTQAGELNSGKLIITRE